MFLQSEFKGPPLAEGPLPAIIYFALSAEESLTLDPFNQPVAAWEKISGLRVFSFTLPGHGPGQDKLKAMSYWAAHWSEVEQFIEEAKREITILTEQGYLNDRIGVAGLSRGAYIALRLAGIDSRIKAICGFAPLIKVEALDEFKSITKPFELSSLIGKPTRLYIGNNDTRVGTKNAYEFIEKLTKISLENGVRSPQTELVIYPSIGYKGHGTPPEIFESGAEWIAEKILGT
jgi:esterase FrsA